MLHASWKTFKIWFTMFVNREVPLPVPSSLSIAGKSLHSLLVVKTPEPDNPPATAGALVISTGQTISDWQAAALFLTRNRQGTGGTPLLVLVDSTLDHDALDERLEILMPARPDGIILTGVREGADLQRLDVALSVAEAMAGREPGETAVVAMIGDNAAGLLAAGNFADRTPRLRALGHNATALAVALGVENSPHHQSADGSRALSRGLTILGAAKAGVAALDWLAPTLAGDDLQRACIEARHAGFAALITENPDQLAAITAAYYG